MNIDEIIRAVQERLGVEADGKAGPETWEAIYNRIVPRKATAKATALSSKQLTNGVRRPSRRFCPRSNPTPARWSLRRPNQESPSRLLAVSAPTRSRTIFTSKGVASPARL